MSRILRARTLVLAFLALVLATPAAALDIREVVSPGGIRAWLVQDATAPVISMSFAFSGGGALDSDGREGASRMMAALLDEGAGPYDSAAFGAEVEAIAARLSFGADADNVTGSLRSLVETRDRAFELLGLALARPRFEPAAIERVRAQMASSLRSSAASPNWIAGRMLSETLFAGHPYARSSDGTPESVAALGAQDVRAAHRRAIRRAGLTVAVVGDIVPEELGMLLDRAFAALPEGEAKVPLPEWAATAVGRTIVVERDVPQSVVVLARPSIRRDDPDWFPAFIMNYILGGGGFSSRLTEEIREKRGLAYGVGTSLQTYRAGGILYGSVATANARVAESIDLIRQEMRRMAAEGVSASELANAKTYLTGSFALNFSSSGAIAGLLLSAQLENLGKDYFSRRQGLIASVTAADVARMAARLLDPEAFTIVVVGKPEGVKATE